MKESIKIELSNINFQFPETKNPVFSNLSLNLEIFNDSEENNLYGIIGPSGIGKTTLISILGAQLKTQQGKVLINETDIYNINDIEKRSLICYQMQTSASLRGSVYSNLIFGLSNNSSQNLINEEFLTNLLIKVGLWSVFKDKDGLNTLIGEGGLNLSGGQRQRLNFASLYLRAIVYKPCLILIDEPTSSLDEISEKAITNMIEELSKNSLVLVVAHRLVTIKTAKGIFDLTLINHDNKQLVPYKSKELIKISKYYKELIEGKLNLEE